MWWKDYLYFSRSQRNGIKLLLVLIVFAVILPGLHRRIFPPGAVDFSAMEKDILAFSRLNEAELTPSGGEAEGGGRASGSGRPAEPAGKESTGLPARVSLNPRPFDPNTLTREEWERMGIPAHVARSIGNYIAAGGIFRYKEDLKRLYMMQDDWYRELEPHVQLPGRQEPVQKGDGERDRTGGSADREIIVDINLADTSALMQIRGIGTVFSSRIIGYRELLGGFVDPAQLLEVYGMDSARWEQLIPHIRVDTAKIRRINLNEATFEDLLRHPYVDRNLANSLVGIRNNHGPYEHAKQIRQSFLVTDTVYERIIPYLTAK